MSLYAAIDLHSSSSVLAVMDGDGKALLQCRCPNDLSRLLADVAPFQQKVSGTISSQPASPPWERSNCP